MPTDIDTYIRQRIQTSVDIYQPCEPSADFSSRVMMGVAKCEKRCAWIRRLSLLAILFSPLIARGIWETVHSDYFSASSLPLGTFIIGAYHAFMSPEAMIMFGAVGITGIFLFIVLPFKRGYRTWGINYRTHIS